MHGGGFRHAHQQASDQVERGQRVRRLGEQVALRFGEGVVAAHALHAGRLGHEKQGLGRALRRQRRAEQHVGVEKDLQRF